MTLTVVGGTVDITPHRSLPLAGYLDRQSNWTSVHDSLEANAVVLRDAGSLVAIVSVDLLYPGARLRRELLKRSGLRPEQLFLAASHTHFAPATSDEHPKLGAVSEDYGLMCAERIGDLLVSLLQQQGQGATFAVGTTGSLDAMNRRRPIYRPSSAPPFIRRRIGFAPNRSAPIDPSARVVRINSQETGQPIAVVWNWSCHPVCFPRRLEVSAEYAGVVRNRLRRDVKRDLPVVFLQGFAGNIRPAAVGRRWGFGPEAFRRWSEQEWSRWAERIAVEVAAVDLHTVRLGDVISVARVEHPLETFVETGGSSRRVSFQAIRLGEELFILGVSAEPSIDYISLLRAMLPPTAMLLPVGCIDATFGYLPTTNQREEGGYEGGGFLPAFSLEGRLSTDIGECALEAFRGVLTSLPKYTASV